jgi:hypothetical protein
MTFLAIRIQSAFTILILFGYYSVGPPVSFITHLIVGVITDIREAFESRLEYFNVYLVKY